jgi:hypothetical protein
MGDVPYFADREPPISGLGDREAPESRLDQPAPDRILREEAKLPILLAFCVAGMIGLSVPHLRHRLLSRR